MWKIIIKWDFTHFPCPHSTSGSLPFIHFSGKYFRLQHSHFHCLGSEGRVVMSRFVRHYFPLTYSKEHLIQLKSKNERVDFLNDAMLYYHRLVPRMRNFQKCLLPSGWNRHYKTSRFRGIRSSNFKIFFNHGEGIIIPN